MLKREGRTDAYANNDEKMTTSVLLSVVTCDSKTNIGFLFTAKTKTSQRGESHTDVLSSNSKHLPDRYSEREQKYTVHSSIS